jgi:predicted alpha/beta hydrolase family esterase
MSQGAAKGLKVFSIPGRGETFEESLGGLIPGGEIQVGFIDFIGRFARMSFPDQVAHVVRIISKKYWLDDALLLGRSFGAWIILNALMGLDVPFPGTAVLISSVLGVGGTDALGFAAPWSRRFWQKAESRSRLPARRLVLIHGTDDEQCPLAHAKRLVGLWHVELIVFRDGGHGLGRTAFREEIAEAIHRIWKLPKGC